MAAASAVGVSQGSEEVWNNKQLLKAVGVLVASAQGKTRSLADIESRLRIAEHVAERLLAPNGGLAGWLEAHHTANFELSRLDSGEILVSLTADGADRFQTRALHEAPRDAAEALAGADEGLRDKRAAVFGELAARAEGRSGSGFNT